MTKMQKTSSLFENESTCWDTYRLITRRWGEGENQGTRKKERKHIKTKWFYFDIYGYNIWIWLLISKILLLQEKVI